MRKSEHSQAEGCQRIEAWLDKHPEAFLTFSGGKDSTVVLHMLKQVQDNPKIAFFDTGLLYHQTYSFMKQIQRRWNVQIASITTDPPPLDVIEASGIWEHGVDKFNFDMKKLLIDNYVEAAHEHFDTPYSIYGLRAEESAGRKYALTPGKGVVSKGYKDGKHTESMSTIWDWSSQDINAYIIEHKVPLNSAYKKLRELGVPSNKRRTGVALSDGIHIGDWALNYEVDPSLGKLLESRLPLLRDFR